VATRLSVTSSVSKEREKLAINPDGTYYAPNIDAFAACEKIEEKPEKVRNKRKTTINMCLGHPSYVGVNTHHQHFCGFVHVSFA